MQFKSGSLANAAFLLMKTSNLAFYLLQVSFIFSVNQSRDPLYKGWVLMIARPQSELIETWKHVQSGQSKSLILDGPESGHLKVLDPKAR